MILQSFTYLGWLCNVFQVVRLHSTQTKAEKPEEKKVEKKPTNFKKFKISRYNPEGPHGSKPHMQEYIVDVNE